MQLTRAADYGIRAMIQLASLPQGSRASIAELAKAAEVPDSFLTKVLQRLAVAGLVISYRGASGGFALALPAGEISMLDVVEALEGPLQLNVCVEMCGQPAGCGRSGWCAAHQVWEDAQQALLRILGDASLERLSRESARRHRGAGRTG